MVEGGSQVSKSELFTKYQIHFLDIIHLKPNEYRSRLLCQIINVVPPTRWRSD